MMQNKEKNFMSAVIYVHNAEKRVGKFLNTVMNVFEENFEHSEIICVNDSSDDNSVDVIKEISKKAKTTTVTVLNMSYYHGLETAMNAGVDLAIGDFVLEFDNTILDFDSSEIMKAYRHSLKGYDIVSQSAKRKQRKSSKLFYFVFEKFTDLKYSMNTESFRVLSRRAINRVSAMNKTIPYRKVIYANCGLKTANLQYQVIDDSNNVSIKDKREKKYRSSLAVDSLILFTDLGYRFSMTMTSIMMLIAVVMAIYSITIFMLKTPVVGWTTTILFLSFCFFGIFGILTIIIKYLQIIVNLVFRRKRYSFESIEKLTK